MRRKFKIGGLGHISEKKNQALKEKDKIWKMNNKDEGTITDLHSADVTAKDIKLIEKDRKLKLSKNTVAEERIALSKAKKEVQKCKEEYEYTKKTGGEKHICDL